ncbi:phosphoribosyltransferase [Halomonas sp. DQ26W]|uniref:phosphoribosyltransferase family protein n=1 Tax=Halomonas sp. DQ26W TaxID=2282311 RepID=UPI000DF7441E|nr:phosphoribosyltransferase [Halomonas sp. DQ26W]RDB44273.1 phosphoribosyltransferase [Halomonas sp. DQ26W]
MNFKTYSELSNDIRKHIGSLHALDIDLVVGIPRSGMIPAYMIALGLNLHCTDIDHFVRGGQLKSGVTRKVSRSLETVWDAKKILLVDDSIFSGKSMKLARNSIPASFTGEIVELAIYSSIRGRNDIDLYLEYVSHPRIFEWNVFHHPILSRSCISIDREVASILREGEGHGKTDVVKSNDFSPLSATYVHSLVSVEGEENRSDIEAWLAERGISYENLVFLDVRPGSASSSRFEAAIEKAFYYKTSKLEFFIEPDDNQALGIFKESGKPVYCSSSNIIYHASAMRGLYTNPASVMTRLKHQSQFFPVPIKNVLKFFYRKFSK